jgi:hypothetical protein
MDVLRQPPESFLAARRALDELPAVLLLQDWDWNEHVDKWVLHCQINLNIQADSPIPQSTNWYVLVDSEYPWGNIQFYPAKEGGITQTFPHQMFNGSSTNKIPWRTGEICVTTDRHLLARYGYEIEPFDPYERLSWHFQRAIEWIQAASLNKLAVSGDTFELPHFPIASGLKVAFSEDSQSLEQWQDISDLAGLLDLLFLPHQTDVLFVKSFRSVQEQDLLALKWGAVMEGNTDKPTKGIWIRLNTVPVLLPWQAPTTWGEFRKVCHQQGIDLDLSLNSVLRFLRDGKPHLLLIGFPIPEQIDSPPHQMHWQPILMPVLSEGTKTANGFRPNEKGYLQRDRRDLLYKDAVIHWVNSENWHPNQISTRGKLPEVLTVKKVLILGAGAMGSAIAELLLRGGVYQAKILDSDVLEVGNLTRHTLDQKYLRIPKSLGVANHLNLASPHARVEAIRDDFPPTNEAERDALQQFEIIFDCTGNDSVLHQLENFPWESTKTFFSISMGLGGKRLFLFMGRGNRFPHITFREKLNPWLHKELQEYENKQLPREGIGCWNPVFPARLDDVWMLASIAVKHIEKLLETSVSNYNFTVFEQTYENEAFTGIHQVFFECCQ